MQMAARWGQTSPTVTTVNACEMGRAAVSSPRRTLNVSCKGGSLGTDEPYRECNVNGRATVSSPRRTLNVSCKWRAFLSWRRARSESETALPPLKRLKRNRPQKNLAFSEQLVLLCFAFFARQGFPAVRQEAQDVNMREASSDSARACK
jgi:hypothetical protein